MAGRSGCESSICTAKHPPIVTTSVRMNASSRRMPKFESASRDSTSSAVMETPARSGRPNRSWSPIAAPMTSATSQATIASSHRIHNGHTSTRG